VRISFCRVFELSTQELHYGEESKEEESEEEEVILRLGVATCDARDRRLDMSSRLLLARYAF
jgi:hypothetical protein